MSWGATKTTRQTFTISIESSTKTDFKQGLFFKHEMYYDEAEELLFEDIRVSIFKCVCFIDP